MLPFTIGPFTKVYKLFFTRITAIYQGSQALYSPYPLPPGGAGVTSSKNQLTSGSGVGIYQEAPVNYCRNTRIRAIPVAAVPLPVNLPINSSHQNLSLAIKISPNFEKIASGRRLNVGQ